MSDAEQAHLFGEPSTATSTKAGQGDTIQKPHTVAEFVREFNKVAPHKHRYDVFRDFVTIAAISIYNALARNEEYEAEYMSIVGQYKQEEVMQFALLLGDVTMMLDPAPSDVLGEIYTALNLANAKTGQYFTPWPIAEFMAQITYGDQLENLDKPFLTVSEPSCGSGVMVLAFAKVLMQSGHNPCKRMWVKCIDIDRLAALMCYIQLSLWNIPAIVYVGNGLTDEYREAFATPAHYFGCWDSKLKMVQMVDAMRGLLYPEKDGEETSVTAEAAVAAESVASSEPPKPVSQNPMQFDFEF